MSKPAPVTKEAAKAEPTPAAAVDTKAIAEKAPTVAEKSPPRAKVARKAPPAKAVSIQAPTAKAQAEAPATPAASQPADVPVKVGKAKKAPEKKAKLVRDSFSIPEADYALFAALKQRALTAGCEVKKSELLRAALSVLSALNDADFAKALAAVERIKTGRPKK